MSNAVSYSVVPRINPQDKEAAPRYYAQARANGDVNIREMADRIQQMCTVTRADILAVLASLEDVMKEILSGGEIARMGDLGTFQVSLSSLGAETEKEFSTANIKKARILFRPGAVLSAMLLGLKYTKVAVAGTKTDEAGGGQTA